MVDAVATDCHGNYPNILRIVSFISLHKIIPILRNIARFVMVVIIGSNIVTADVSSAESLLTISEQASVLPLPSTQKQ